MQTPPLSSKTGSAAREPLDETSVAPDPIDQFRHWFEQARQAQPIEPEAMTLATATPDGRPSARMVLLKQFDERGFVLYTNYESRKGRELTANPRAALVFWWPALGRQVRIEGEVTPISPAESDAYFASRPLGSQISAGASPQSQVLENRAALQALWDALEARYQDHSFPRPPHWGGYRLRPTTIEFWQGRPDRLHDRIRYRLADDGSWVIERLAP